MKIGQIYEQIRCVIHRKAGKRLSELIRKKGELNNVLLVEGARQVGKTTLVRQVFHDLQIPFREFNLEEERTLAERIDRCVDFSQFSELVQTVLKFKIGGNEILFIDEAQESRHLGRFVRFMKEKWNRTQVILSGSSMARIFREDVRYPVGRVTSIHLQPFSFEEFLLAAGEESLAEILRNFPSTLRVSPDTHQRLLELLDLYLERGGLPEVVTSSFEGGNWKEIREEILLGYFNDFKRVFGEDRQAYFIAALKATAHLLGSPFKNSRVASLLDGGKNQEIIRCLSQLESWKMVFRIEQRGPAVETHFHPKRYLFDAGIAKQLRETSIPRIGLTKSLEMVDRTPVGGLVENGMVTNLISQYGGELTGWKKASSGSEVDFVIKREGKIVPVECKAALSIKNSHLGGLVDCIKTSRVSLGVVVALAPFEIRKLADRRKILILPLYLGEFLEGILASVDRNNF